MFYIAFIPVKIYWKPIGQIIKKHFSVQLFLVLKMINVKWRLMNDKVFEVFYLFLTNWVLVKQLMWFFSENNDNHREEKTIQRISFTALLNFPFK